MTILQHIRIPSVAPHFPTYSHAVAVQSKLQARLLEYKASQSSSSLPPNETTAPPPSLISFTPAPTYTLGRRQVGPLSAAEEQRLRAPLRVRHGDTETSYEPEVVSAPRGGLATYHGPGQIVFWPVVDLHSPHHRHFTVRDYACLLEKTTIAALARVTRDGNNNNNNNNNNERSITGFTTDNPGVWVHHSPTGRWGSTRSQKEEPRSEERKISALGVHLRRHVTGLGVAVNVSMPVAGPEETNPWARIVACGIADKAVTNMVAELHGNDIEQESSKDLGRALQDELQAVWAEEFTDRLGITTGSKAAEGPL